MPRLPISRPHRRPPRRCERRLRACELLGWKNVPVTVIDIDQIVRGEFAENAFRRDFLPSEIDAIRRVLEKRMTNGGKGVKVSQPCRRRTLDANDVTSSLASEEFQALPLVRDNVYVYT